MVVNPIMLFSRLAANAGTKDGVEKYFDFELTHPPRDLFKNKLMRKSDKESIVVQHIPYNWKSVWLKQTKLCMCARRSNITALIELGKRDEVWQHHWRIY